VKYRQGRKAVFWQRCVSRCRGGIQQGSSRKQRSSYANSSCTGITMYYKIPNHTRSGILDSVWSWSQRFSLFSPWEKMWLDGVHWHGESVMCKWYDLNWRSQILARIIRNIFLGIVLNVFASCRKRNVVMRKCVVAHMVFISVICNK